MIVTVIMMALMIIIIFIIMCVSSLHLQLKQGIHCPFKRKSPKLGVNSSFWHFVPPFPLRATQQSQLSSITTTCEECVVITTVESEQPSIRSFPWASLYPVGMLPTRVWQLNSMRVPHGSGTGPLATVSASQRSRSSMASGSAWRP